MPRRSFAENPEPLQYGSRLGTNLLPDTPIGGISGNWSWRHPETQPDAGTREYEAVFIPADIENYASISAKIPVTTLPAVPSVTEAHASVKSGTLLSEVSNITYTAVGIKGEALTGAFQLAEDDIALTQSRAGDYLFTFQPPNPNYTSAETQVSIAVTGGTSSGGSSRRPSTPSYTVAYDVGDQGIIVAGSRTETVKEGSYPVKVPTVKVETTADFLGWSLDGKTLIQPETVLITENTVFRTVYLNRGQTVIHKSYIEGYEDGSFRPEASIRRAETSAILARISGTDAEYQNQYSDVSESDWYAPAVAQVTENGFMAGNPDGTFKPDQPITRAELAAVAARYLRIESTLSSGFDDCAGHWADSSIAALTDREILSGYEDGTFRPDNPITRAEAVKLINGILSRSEPCSTATDNPFKDVSLQHWAYRQILEAAQQHKAETVMDKLEKRSAN